MEPYKTRQNFNARKRRTAFSYTVSCIPITLNAAVIAAATTAAVYELRSNGPLPFFIAVLFEAVTFMVAFCIWKIPGWYGYLVQYCSWVMRNYEFRSLGARKSSKVQASVTGGRIGKNHEKYSTSSMNRLNTDEMVEWQDIGDFIMKDETLKTGNVEKGARRRATASFMYSGGMRTGDSPIIHSASRHDMAINYQSNRVKAAAFRINLEDETVMKMPDMDGTFGGYKIRGRGKKNVNRARDRSNETLQVRRLSSIVNKSRKKKNLLTKENVFKTILLITRSRYGLTAGFFRNILWCIVWIWATAFMRRDFGNKHIFAWDFSKIPSAYGKIENVFLWSVTFDYCLDLAVDITKLKHFFTLSAAADLITLPLTTFFLNLLWPLPPSRGLSWLLFFGYLRFLRLVKSGSILTDPQWNIMPVTLRIWTASLTLVAIALTHAGAMFILESPVKLENGDPFNNLFDYFYVTVQNVSTVAYGDYPIQTVEGRIITSLLICITFIYIIGEFKRINTARKIPRNAAGTAPRFGEEYICFVGPLQPNQLALICREMYQSFPDAVHSIVLFSPLPVEKYASVVNFVLQNCDMRVFVRASENKYFFPEKLQDFIGSCRSICVFCNTRPWGDSDANANMPSDAIEQEEDHITLVRFLGTRNRCSPDQEICVQLLHDYRKAVVSRMGAKFVMCLNETKMKLLGKSCLDCPGFVTLVGNWFYNPTRLQTSHNQWADDDMVLYGHGSCYQIYRVPFAACFKGVNYKALVQVLYKYFNVFLIGIVSTNNKIWLNPTSYNVGEETSRNPYYPFSGIVLSPSLEVVLKISNLTEDSYTKGKEDMFSLDPTDFNGKSEFNEAAKSTRGTLDSIDKLVLTPRRQSRAANKELLQCGVYRVESLEDARLNIFSDSSKKVIVACGWPRGIKLFMKTVCGPRKCNVIILAPFPSDAITRDELLQFVDCCAFVSGSPLSTNDLKRSGILECKSCVVFCAPHVNWRCNLSSEKLDVQAVLAINTVTTLIASHQRQQDTVEINARSEDYRTSRLCNADIELSMLSPGDIDVQETQVKRNRSFVEYLDDNGESNEFGGTRVNSIDVNAEPDDAALQNEGDINIKNEELDVLEPFMVAEFKNGAFLDYLSEIPGYLEGLTKWRTDKRFSWDGPGSFTSMPDFASGRVFVDEMLHGIMAYNTSFSKYAIDISIVDNLVMGNEAAHGVNGDKHEDVRPCLPTSTQSSNYSEMGSIKMENIPLMFEGQAFNRLFFHLFKFEKKLVLGIYRRFAMSYDPPGIPVLFPTLPVVLSCPRPNMKLQKGDMFFFVTPDVRPFN